MDKLLNAEHNELLEQGISNFLELPKQVKKYLHQEQLKRKEFMDSIQSTYTNYSRTSKEEGIGANSRATKVRESMKNEETKQAGNKKKASVAEEQKQKNET